MFDIYAKIEKTKGIPLLNFQRRDLERAFQLTTGTNLSDAFAPTFVEADTEFLKRSALILDKYETFVKDKLEQEEKEKNTLYASNNHVYKAIIPPDDGTDIAFKWHFPYGTLKPRMSGLELAIFVLHHMQYILPLLTGHPRIKVEFEAMMVKLATAPKQAIDELLPWIRSVTQEEEDDVIHMSLFDKTQQPEGPRFYV